MAYIIESLKKINIKKRLHKERINQENKILIFIILLSAIVITVDYALIIKFINIIESI